MILLNTFTNKDILVLLLYAIPYLIIIGGIIYNIVKYIKKHGVNYNSIMTITKSLANNEQFKKIVDEAIKLIAETTSIEYAEELDNAITSLKKYLSTYLYSNMQLTDSIIETDPKDDMIADVLKENNINIDNIENIINSILNTMGYNDTTIKYLIVEAVKEKNKK